MRVENIEHLKQLSLRRSRKFYIQLIGWVKSFKRIRYNRDLDQFSIVDERNDTMVCVPSAELENREFTNICIAIQKRAFYTVW